MRHRAPQRRQVDRGIERQAPKAARSSGLRGAATGSASPGENRPDGRARQQATEGAREKRGDAVRPWQPRPRGDRRVRGFRRAAAPRFCRRPSSRPAISNSLGPRSATGSTALAARGAAAHSGGSRHALCREPREERPAVGDRTASPPRIRRVELRFGRELAIEPKLLAAARDRIEAAERAAPARCRAPTRCCSSSAAAPTIPTPIPTSPSSRACCGEGMGFGWAEAAFSGVAAPLVEPALRRLVRAGLSAHRRLPLFPLHRRAGEAHLRGRAPRRRGPSRDRVLDGALSQRPSAGARLLSPTARARSRTASPR